MCTTPGPPPSSRSIRLRDRTRKPDELLIATHDFELVESIGAIRPLTIAFSAAYLALSLRFWFYRTVNLTGTAMACFTVATVLSG